MRSVRDFYRSKSRISIPIKPCSQFETKFLLFSSPLHLMSNELDDSLRINPFILSSKYQWDVSQYVYAYKTWSTSLTERPCSVYLFDLPPERRLELLVGCSTSPMFYMIKWYLQKVPMTKTEESESEQHSNSQSHQHHQSLNIHINSPEMVIPQIIGGQYFSPTSSRSSSIDNRIHKHQDQRKKHICSKCSGRFSRPSSLRIHQNTHTGATRTFQSPLNFSLEYCAHSI